MSAIGFDAVCVRFGKRAALEDITATIPAGAITGIVGPNGAGKTTLLRAALGLEPAEQGMVQVLGSPLSSWSREALARAVAYLPQGGQARWPMRAADVVMLGRLPHRARMVPPDLKDQLAVSDALARCDASDFAARRMDELSAGERARVLFARALATGASVLLADEPAAFLDPAHQIRLMELLAEEARRGTAVAVTLHDLPLAMHHCDEILVLHDGRLAAAGAPQEALSAHNLAQVFRIAADPATPGAFQRI